jgi:UDP-N-acetylmuramyl tripeptide synthase
MTKILVSPDNPKGKKLEVVLDELRSDLLQRSAHILDDRRPDVAVVLRNNVDIMVLLGQCLEKARESARVLERLG